MHGFVCRSNAAVSQAKPGPKVGVFCTMSLHRFSKLCKKVGSVALLCSNQIPCTPCTSYANFSPQFFAMPESWHLSFIQSLEMSKHARTVCVMNMSAIPSILLCFPFENCVETCVGQC